MVTVRERLRSHIDTAKLANDIPSKLEYLGRIKEYMLLGDPVLVTEFLPDLYDLQSDRFSPARKFVIELFGEIGLQHLNLLPDIVPAFICVVQDDTPAVARQAISSGSDLFRRLLQMIGVQGLCSGELDCSLVSSWNWILTLKDRIFSIAFQPGSSGVRLMALKFVETLILLYTPDPNGTLEPPPRGSFGGNLEEFNMSWLHGGHPTLSFSDMSAEATRSLDLLLNHLRFPTVKSLSNSMIILLIKIFSTIAKQRPAFYDRIIAVLLGLDLSNPVLKSMKGFGVSHALKKALMSSLECTHPSVAGWRNRILGALNEINAGDLAEKAFHDVYETNGNLDHNEVTDAKEENPSNEVCDADSGNLRWRRPEVQGGSDLAEDGDLSGKRIKAMPSISDEPTRYLNRISAVSQHEVPANEVNSSSCSKADGEDEVPPNMSMADSDINMLPTYLPDVFPPSSSCRERTSVTRTENLVTGDLESQQEELDLPAAISNVVISSNIHHERENKMLTPGLSFHSDVSPSDLGKGLLAIPSDISDSDMGNVESQILGLDTPVSAFSGSHTEVLTEEQVSQMVRTPKLDVSPLVSVEQSEECSPKEVVTDVHSVVSSSKTSSQVSHHFVHRKLSAPVVDLDDKKKDALQNLAFVRIVEAYKQIALARGAEVRSSLVVLLGVQFPQKLDPWKELQQHILSDYMKRDGHELTLRVLYRLFGEAEMESDFIISSSATYAYEKFLSTVAQTLKDSFPPWDKSLSRLLGEVPYLPPSILKLMECLCCPESCDIIDKENNVGKRVTQGLTTMLNLILLRPTVRDVCLEIVLQSAVHPLEQVRVKAICLVANKLYSLQYTAQKVEEFAKGMLISVSKGGISGSKDVESVITEQKVLALDKTSNDHTSAADSHQSENTPLLVSEAQRYLSIYFALCTKRHSLFREIFVIYKNIPNSVKQALDQHIPFLVRTMGQSSELLNILSDPPSGSEDLLFQVLHILISWTSPSPELIHTIKKLFDTKVKDIKLLIPVLPFLPKDEVAKIFPHLVSLPSDKFHAALGQMLQGPYHSSPVFTPAEILIAIHGIDPEKDGIPLKKVTDACNACFEQHQHFTHQVLAEVLNQLIEQIPLPLLYMRTVLQAIGTFPSLVDFIMDILSRLVRKQIWTYPKLWVGFLKCAQVTKPQSFSVLLQLPPTQLENALIKIPALRVPLVVHAKQPDICSSLPRSTLVVLGIVSDAQASGQAQSSHTQSQGTITDTQALSHEQSCSTQNQDMATVSDAEASSQAQSSQTQNQQDTVTFSDAKALSNQTQHRDMVTSTLSDAQLSSQPQSSPTNNQDKETLSDAQAASQRQSSPTNNQDKETLSNAQASSQPDSSPRQTQDTGNSGREMTTVKSKDSSVDGTQNQDIATVSDAEASSQAHSSQTQNQQDTVTFSDAQAPSNQTQNHDMLTSTFSDPPASSQPQSSPTNNQDKETLSDARASSQP